MSYKTKPQPKRSITVTEVDAVSLIKAKLNPIELKAENE
jgi:CRP-like cAMP-binding protein